MMDFGGQVAVVTGGAQGIGQAVAARLAQCGARCVIWDMDDELARAAAAQIKTGAENGSEMGAFEHLMQPQREANLAIRLKEYMPYGMTAGTFFMT